LGGRDGDGGTRAADRIVQQIGKSGAVIADRDRQRDELIEAIDLLLRHLVIFQRDAGTAAPQLGEFTPQIARQRFRRLVIGNQLLLDSDQVEFQHLIRTPELWLEKLG
jgi:hypothetical protein